MFLDDMSTSHRHTQIQEQVKKIAIVDIRQHMTTSQLTYVEQMKEF